MPKEERCLDGAKFPNDFPPSSQTELCQVIELLDCITIFQSVYIKFAHQEIIFNNNSRTTYRGLNGSSIILGP